MIQSNAERQALWRERQKERIAGLEAEAAQLRSALQALQALQAKSPHQAQPTGNADQTELAQLREQLDYCKFVIPHLWGLAKNALEIIRIFSDGIRDEVENGNVDADDIALLERIGLGPIFPAFDIALLEKLDLKGFLPVLRNEDDT